MFRKPVQVRCRISSHGDTGGTPAHGRVSAEDPGTSECPHPHVCGATKQGVTRSCTFLLRHPLLPSPQPFLEMTAGSSLVPLQPGQGLLPRVPDSVCGPRPETSPSLSPPPQAAGSRPTRPPFPQQRAVPGAPAEMQSALPAAWGPRDSGRPWVSAGHHQPRQGPPCRRPADSVTLGRRGAGQEQDPGPTHRPRRG